MTEPRNPQVLPTKKRAHYLERYSEADLPTARGLFHAIVFRDRRDKTEHVALVAGDVAGADGGPVGVHSGSLPNAGFGRLQGDFRQQLAPAPESTGHDGRGAIPHT